MEARRTRTRRDEWRKRVERWRSSGLSAEAFAAELGTKPATLKFWKYRIDQEAKAAAPSKPIRKGAPPPAALVEVHGSAGSAPTSFVLELGAHRLQIPATFDERTLERLLAVLEKR